MSLMSIYYPGNKLMVYYLLTLTLRGVARIIQRRGVTLCQSEGSHQIVMLFSPPVVGCLLKKGLQKEGTRAPQDPLATPLLTLHSPLQPYMYYSFTLS